MRCVMQASDFLRVVYGQRFEPAAGRQSQVFYPIVNSGRMARAIEYIRESIQVQSIVKAMWPWQAWACLLS